MKERISEIVFSVSAITFMAYASTYAYYAGCFEYYGIPSGFLKIDANSVLRFLQKSLILGAIVILLVFFECVHALVFSKLKAWGMMVLMLLMVDGIASQSNFKTMFWIVAIGVICGLLLLNLDCQTKQSKKEDNVYKSKEVLIVSIVILYILFSILAIMFDLGKNHCEKKEEYFTISEWQDGIILQETDDYFIVGKYDSNKHEFEQDFRIVDKENQEIKKINIEK